MRRALFHAESGDEGYDTQLNHDMPADRFLAYQHPAVIQALHERKLIKRTGDPDFPWRLTVLGREVGRLIVIETTKQEAMLD